MPRNKSTNDWADAAQKVVIKAIASGYTITTAATIVLCVLLFRMDSKDIKELGLAILQNPFINGLGWAVALVAIAVCRFVMKKLKALYREQLSIKDDQIKILLTRLPPPNDKLL